MVFYYGRLHYLQSSAALSGRLHPSRLLCDVQYSQMEELIILPPPPVGQLVPLAGIHPLEVRGKDPETGKESHFLAYSRPLD